MASNNRSAIGVVMILIITFCSAFLVTRWAEGVGQIDTTEQKIYTLSDGSKAIIDRLQKPLDLKLFYSKTAIDKLGQDNARGLHNFYNYVRELLASYARYSDGKLTLEEFDPVGFSDSEEEADRLGIRRIQDLAEDGLYFGMAVVSETGSQEVMPVFDVSSQSQIEYRVSEMIELAAGRRKPKIGVLSSLDVTGDGMTDMMRQMRRMQGQPVQDPWASIQQLGRLFEVENVPADSDTIDNASFNTLLVIHPKNLGEKTLYAIDQFVMNGGKLICFVDPHAFDADPAPQNPQNPMAAQGHDASSNLNRLLEKWGVRMEPGKFAGDRSLAFMLRANRMTRTSTPFVGWIQLNKQERPGVGINTDEMITQSFPMWLDVMFPGVLKESETKPDGVEIKPLLTTSDYGHEYTAQGFEIAGFQGQPDIEGLLKKVSPAPGRELMIGARISGKLPSAFDAAPESPADEGDGATGDEAEDEAETPDSPEHVAASSEATTVIVVADVDMLSDARSFNTQFRQMGIVQPVNSNFAFLMNAIEFVGGSEDLIKIRSRSDVQRPFAVLDEIEREADERTREELDRIKAEIDQFNKDIQSIDQGATAENVRLVQDEQLRKKADAEKKIRERQREQRKLQKEKNEAIDGLKSNVRAVNVWILPLLVLFLGVALASGGSSWQRYAALAMAGVLALIPVLFF